MDEVQIVRKRTHIWPIVIALIVLALVIAYAIFAVGGGTRSEVGWNGVVHWEISANGDVDGIA